MSSSSCDELVGESYPSMFRIIMIGLPTQSMSLCASIPDRLRSYRHSCRYRPSFECDRKPALRYVVLIVGMAMTFSLISSTIAMAVEELLSCGDCQRLPCNLRHPSSCARAAVLSVKKPLQRCTEMSGYSEHLRPHYLTEQECAS